MNICRSMAVVALLVGTPIGLAHTHLEKSVPAEGSTLKAAPSEIVLTFAEPVRVTAFSLHKGTEPAQKLAPLPTASQAEIRMPLPHLAAGAYVVTWRVVSGDGHVMPGKLHFTIVDGAS